VVGGTGHYLNRARGADRLIDLHGAGERTQDQQCSRRPLVDRPQCEQSQRNGARRRVDQAASLQALQMEFPVREIDWADVLYLLYRSVRITPQTQRE
jgi:hypothetical protein